MVKEINKSLQDIKVGDRLHADERVTQGYINMLKHQDEKLIDLITAYSNYCHASNKDLDIKGLLKLANHTFKWSERIK